MLGIEMLTKCFLSVLFVVSIDCTLGLNETLSRLKRNDANCGIPSQATSLIISGYGFQRGTWPWMVALLEKTTSPPKLFCGGVLVSTTKVLTGESTAG